MSQRRFQPRKHSTWGRQAGPLAGAPLWSALGSCRPAPEAGAPQRWACPWGVVGSLVVADPPVVSASVGVGARFPASASCYVTKQVCASDHDLLSLSLKAMQLQEPSFWLFPAGAFCSCRVSFPLSPGAWAPGEHGLTVSLDSVLEEGPGSRPW